jgi:hypothetical protein
MNGPLNWRFGTTLALAVAWALSVSAQETSKPAPAPMPFAAPVKALETAPPAISPGAARVAAAPASDLAQVPTSAGQDSHASGATAPTTLSPWANEIAKMARAGIQPEVLLSYIDNTEGTFNLDADQIIYLRNLGVSSQAIAAMIQHDSLLTSGLRAVMSTAVPGPEPALHIVVAPVAAAQEPNQPPIASSPATTAADGSAAEGQRTSLPAVDDAANPDWSDLMDQAPQDDFADDFASPVAVRTAGLTKGYPVRQPYPVQLLAPIIVLRASGRTPNLVLIQFGP